METLKQKNIIRNVKSIGSDIDILIKDINICKDINVPFVIRNLSYIIRDITLIIINL